MPRKLKRRTYARWEKMIQQILDDEVKIKVACIVWWDFIKEQGPAWTGLDKYFNMWPPKCDPYPALIEQALIRFGYPRKVAKLRSYNYPKQIRLWKQRAVANSQEVEIK